MNGLVWAYVILNVVWLLMLGAVVLTVMWRDLSVWWLLLLIPLLFAQPSELRARSGSED